MQKKKGKSKKKIIGEIKLQIPAGKATPAAPIGPALGQKGLNIMEFCKAYNAHTQKDEGSIIPVIITVYEDRSFDFITKTPPAASLIKKSANIQKGSSEPNKNKVGKITKEQIEEIARKKIADLNCYDISQAMKLIAGTAKSMGIEVPRDFQ